MVTERSRSDQDDQYTPTVELSPQAPADDRGPVSRLKVVTTLSKNPAALNVTWSLIGQTQARKYSMTIRDAQAREVFSKQNLAARNVSWVNPKAGAFAWTVTADLEDGSTVVARGNVTVAGSEGGATIVLILLLVAAGMAGVWWLDKSGMLPYARRKGPAVKGERV